MRAIDCEYLEVFSFGVAHPAGDFSRFTVQRVANRVTVGRKARLAGGELIDRPQRNEAIVFGILPFSDGREKIPHDRYTQKRTYGAVEQHGDFQQHLTPVKSAG
jgi:hypothetical protein